MGYTTEFEGRFKFNKELDDDTYDLLVGLATTRRMKRNIEGYGIEGEFYCADRENFGQNRTPDVIDSNKPPRTQPSLWLKWIPTNDRLHLEWDGGEKFYSYVEWLKYLISKILSPRGYKLNGQVVWFGEDRGDMGAIVVEDNKVSMGRVSNVDIDVNDTWSP